MIRATLLAAMGVAIAFGAMCGSTSAQNQQFNNYARKPSMSPYMNLVNNNTGIATNYQSLVRPQLDQRNFNQASSSAIKQLQKGASSGSSKSGAEGNKKLRATGHIAATENYSHFYPSMKQKR